MSLYPVPSPRHAEPTLQPSYFTSSLFIESLRQDVASLVSEFRSQLGSTEPPFQVFKRVWRLQRWHLLHFRVLDDRSREVFLKSTCRIFLEATHTGQPLLTRATGMLALYTFHATQPLDTTPSLWNLKHIPLPFDQLLGLQNLDRVLETSELVSLRSTVSYALSYFRQHNVFLVLPHSTLFPENPRSLPRERYVDQGRVTSADMFSNKKKGRPTKNDKTRKAKSAMDALDDWLGKTEPLTRPSSAVAGASATSAPSKLEEYSVYKAELLQSIIAGDAAPNDQAAIAQANDLILQRLKDVRELVPEDDDNESSGEPADVGIKRVELALEDMRNGTNGGVLNLIEGAGKRH